MNKGLWINDKTFIRFSEEQKYLTEELATRRGAIDFYSLGMYLPNPDPVLKRQGKDITVYNDLLADPHIGACVKSRKSGVLSLEWGIDRGKAKSMQAKVIESVFGGLNLQHIISEVLNAVFFGYQALEVIWQNAGGYLLPESITGKPQHWFVFDDENRLRLRTKDNHNGIELPDRKFLLIQYEPTYANPYGMPELSRCFWPVTFKKGGMKFWVTFTERYGMPFFIGKHPRGTGRNETDKLADMLETMVQDAVAVIPDDSSVEIQEAGGKASSAAIYRELIDICNSEISKAILGQTLTTQQGESGSYALGAVHFDVRKDIIDADKRLVEGVMSDLIKWIYELNFAPAVSSSDLPRFSMWEDEDVDKPLAERDEILTRAGVKFTKKYFQKGYGFEDEDLEVAAPPARIDNPGAIAMSEAKKQSPFSDQQALDNAADSITPEVLQAQMESVLKPIIDLVNEGNDHNAIMEKLVEAYPDMDTKAVEDMLARAIFVSEMWGRLNA